MPTHDQVFIDARCAPLNLLHDAVVQCLTLVLSERVLQLRPQFLRQRFQRPAKQAMQLGRLGNALDLTPAQIDQLKQIREANKSQREAITQELRQKRQALRELMAQNNPDPAQVGNAMLGLKQAQKRGQELRQQGAGGRP